MVQSTYDKIFKREEEGVLLWLNIVLQLVVLDN